MACAIEIGLAPKKPEYEKWRRRRLRRGEDPPTPSRFLVVYNLWETALYDAGLVAQPGRMPGLE